MQPTHIAFVLDGNRRYAASHKLQTLSGHDTGAKKLEEILPYVKKKGFTQITLYVFSTENFKRSELEVSHLFSLFTKYFSDKKTISRFLKEDASIKFIGNMSLFPQSVQDAASQMEKKTANCKSVVVNFAMGYGGREELTNAMRQIAQKVKAGIIDEKNINEELINNHLYLKSEPQIIIRTGAAIRTSNFLPWQSIYSEWFFLDKLWPEFTTKDVDEILNAYQKRKINHGK